MKSGDLALTPQIAFNGTKATITAWAGAVVGMEAYATDTSEKGVFDGSAWRWSSISGGGGGGTWGSITGTISDQADLQGELDNKQPIDSILTSLSGLAVAAGDLIIGLTSSTLQRLGVGVDTSDAKYLKRGVGPNYLHEWAIPTTAEVASSTNKRYVTDADLAVIGNTSGTNTGDDILPLGIATNYKLSVTVASGNLTLALKGLDGNDPSPTNPIKIQIGGAVRTITYALSVTKNAGTNWCNAGGAVLAAKELDMFAYLIWNTTPATDIVDIGFSRYPNFEIYSDASSTTTNEKYLAYGNASAPNAADNMVVIGRFAATLSASASYNWSVPTYTAKNLIQRPIYETRELDFNTAPTNLTIGNGTTNAAKYKRFFNDCEVFWKFTLGNTSAVSGAAPYIELPFTASASIPTSNMVAFGEARYDDTGIATYYGKTDFGAGAQYMRFLVNNASSTYLLATQVGTTVPFTWGNADALSGRMRYPTA